MEGEERMEIKSLGLLCYKCGAVLPSMTDLMAHDRCFHSTEWIDDIPSSPIKKEVTGWVPYEGYTPGDGDVQVLETSSSLVNYPSDPFGIYALTDAVVRLTKGIVKLEKEMKKHA
jgi:hypothetical protein